MSSLYLGTIKAKSKRYEIHAFTKDLAWRNYAASEIADSALYADLLAGRFEVLRSGKPIFCTAVNPDPERRIEENPHDSREGTVHIVSLGKEGKIDCAVSVAVDTNQKEGGCLIGLPLENRWRPNGYPEGASLDRFRKHYLRLNYREERDIAPWEMAELYRHFKRPGEIPNILCMVSVYTGCYQLLVRDARMQDLAPTWLWLFDAIPAYFNLYRIAGAAFLRDAALEDKPRVISPGRRDLEARRTSGASSIYYRGECVSRNVKVPIPSKGESGLRFDLEDVPFLDGLVDLRRIERAITGDPEYLSLGEFEGLDRHVKIRLRLALAVMAREAFREDCALSALARFLNQLAFQKLGVDSWEFDIPRPSQDAMERLSHS
jgi:hypothetical protein